MMKQFFRSPRLASRYFSQDGALPLLHVLGATVFVAVCAALTSSSVVAAASRGDDQPFLRVGWHNVPPTVDGVLAPGEWDDAACVGGLRDLANGRLLAVQPRLHLAFDDTALYVAVAVPAVRGAQLRAKARERDGAVYSDDSVELFFSPGPTEKPYYQFVVNSLGTLFDADGREPAWNALGARAGASKTGSEWVVELPIPFADLGVQSPVEGMQWGVNIGLNCPSRGTVTGSWAKVDSGFHDPANFAHIAFTRSGPVVAVTGFDRLLFGRGELALRLIGSGTARSRLEAWRVGAVLLWLSKQESMSLTERHVSA